MAADAYLKAAAAQLQGAAGAIKMQIDEIRSTSMTTENQLKHDIDKNEREVKALMGRQGLNNEPATAGALNVQIARYKADTENKKKELQAIQAQASQAISAKEGAMNDVISEARILENKAGNPALR